MKNYLTYPCKTMNITQGYNDSYTHRRHNTGNPKDYPFDEAGIDYGRDYFFCPCDEMVVVRVYGVGNGGSNTIWLESTSKVVMPYGEDYITIMVTHPNDSDLKKFKSGQKYKRGAAMFREGTDGQATGNHLHIAVATGKYTGTGWVKNSNGAWVLKTSGVPLKPEQAFYVNKSFTKIKNSKGISFKTMPTEVEIKFTSIDKEYKVTGTGSTLNVRSGPDTSYSIVGSYKDDTILKATKLSDNWVFVNNKGWCSLNYLKEYIEEKKSDPVPGDIDGDGKVTSADARLAMRASVNLETLTDEQKKNADVDGDGKVTSADARTIMRKSVGLE